tara:strand:- start:1005 stop:1673 length:669 start_codon:yes stop_codon:yes gene_type:complete
MQQLGNIIPKPKLGSSDAPTLSEGHTAPIGTLSSKPIGVGSQLAKALIAFHKTRPFVEEKSKNTFFTDKKGKASTYASLEEAITVCRKAVDFDLTFTQNINFDGNEYYVSTIILHSSGETLSDRTPIKCKDYNDAHKFYGSVSYARRYSILSSFSCPTADNDGISAMGWDQDDDPYPDPKPDLNSLIANAKSQKELNDLYKKHKPTDEKIIQKFKTKKGELN